MNNDEMLLIKSHITELYSGYNAESQINFISKNYIPDYKKGILLMSDKDLINYFKFHPNKKDIFAKNYIVGFSEIIKDYNDAKIIQYYEYINYSIIKNKDYFFKNDLKDLSYYKNISYFISLPDDTKIEDLTYENIQELNEIFVNLIFRFYYKNKLLITNDKYNEITQIFLNSYGNNLSIDDYEFCTHYIVKYPEHVIISDTGYKWPVKDIYVIYTIDKVNNALCNIECIRGSRSYEEFYTDYTFSHASVIGQFCFGNGEFKKNIDLLKRDNSFVKNSSLELLESTLITFDTYIKLESIEGGPYISIENFYKDSNNYNHDELKEKSKILLKKFLENTDYDIKIKSLGTDINDIIDYTDLKNKLLSLNTEVTNNCLFNKPLRKYDINKSKIDEWLKIKNEHFELLYFKGKPVKERVYNIKEEFKDYYGNIKNDDEVVYFVINILQSTLIDKYEKEFAFEEHDCLI